MKHIFYTYIFFIPLVAFITTVILKFFIEKIKVWKWNIARSISSWWMPSSHSAIVTSLTMAIFLKEWFDSTYFALAFSFSSIVIYDALNIRYQAWLHAKEINKINWNNNYNESLWHLPSEVFVWSIIGILTAFILYYI